MNSNFHIESSCWTVFKVAPLTITRALQIPRKAATRVTTGPLMALQVQMSYTKSIESVGPRHILHDFDVDGQLDSIAPKTSHDPTYFFEEPYNYCRNPNGWPAPWCHSTRPNVDLEFCFSSCMTNGKTNALLWRYVPKYLNASFVRWCIVSSQIIYELSVTKLIYFIEYLN